MPTNLRPQLQAGYILHARPYRDSSKLLEIFTCDFGRISLVARGVRSARARHAAQLEAFVPLLFSWTGQGELRTLTAVEPAGPGPGLPGRRILSGFYLNELLLRLLQREDAHAQLFHDYVAALQALADREHVEEIALRRFERILLEEIGYGMQLQLEADSGEALHAEAHYCYDPDIGPLRLPPGQRSEHPVVQGRTLLALATDQYPDEQTRREAKQLMRFLLNRHLDARPLRSRELYWQSKHL